MKIDSVNSMKNDPVKNKKGTDPKKGIEFDQQLQKTKNTQELSKPLATQVVDALWAVQEVETTLEKKKKAVKKGGKILDLLDLMQKSLVTGGLEQKILSDLQSLVNEKQEKLDDPQLQDLLDAINLRAAVEAAKFSKP